jgi:protein-S-isoprenylcysteine O-methyltransferase Ste14
MGSLMGGRILEGLGQIVVAVAGFALVMTWFVSVMIQYYGMINDQETSFQPRAWLGIAGIITFGVAWLWALATSMNLVREARRKELAQRHQELQRPVEDKSN